MSPKHVQCSKVPSFQLTGLQPTCMFHGSKLQGSKLRSQVQATPCGLQIQGSVYMKMLKASLNIFCLCAKPHVQLCLNHCYPNHAYDHVLLCHDNAPLSDSGNTHSMRRRPLPHRPLAPHRNRQHYVACLTLCRPMEQKLITFRPTPKLHGLHPDSISPATLQPWQSAHLPLPSHIAL